MLMLNSLTSMIVESSWSQKQRRLKLSWRSPIKRSIKRIHWDNLWKEDSITSRMKWSTWYWQEWKETLDPGDRKLIQSLRTLSSAWIQSTALRLNKSHSRFFIFQIRTLLMVEVKLILQSILNKTLLCIETDSQSKFERLNREKNSSGRIRSKLSKESNKIMSS